MNRLTRLAAVSCLLFSASAWSAEIAFFDNDTYTDPTRESANLIAELSNHGHNVTVFSGITAADWSIATAGANLLVIPELDNGSLGPDLAPDALAAIANYVGNGGGMIGISSNRPGSVPYNDVTLWNAIFGFTLEHSSVETPITLVSADLPWVGGPANLPDPSATEGLVTASLPAGAQSIYTDNTGATVVSEIPYGTGTFVQLGFDWFEDDPVSPEWNNILGRAVDAAAGDVRLVPVPTLSGLGITTMIALFALFGVTVVRRLT